MKNIDKAKRAEIMRTLRQFKFNVSAACKHLGISRATFYRNVKKLNLELKPKHEPRP